MDVSTKQQKWSYLSVDNYIQSHKPPHIQHNGNRSFQVNKLEYVMSPSDDNLHGNMTNVPRLSLIKRYKRTPSSDGMLHVGNMFSRSSDPAITNREMMNVSGSHHTPTLPHPPSQESSMMHSKAHVVNNKINRSMFSRSNRCGLKDIRVFSPCDVSDDEVIKLSSLSEPDKIKTVVPVPSGTCSPVPVKNMV